ncbi:hypothetical protein CYY_005304 [Polysphondylium violaceum]|uniref:Pmp22 family protein n=1 Tax=Polysphondylium violaceum TaxID=133409 RepID=A0A8J4Q3E9_9MYCE|nr:hypothetical protein CYY_005304 [Polysphondylium violaceum]
MKVFFNAWRLYNNALQTHPVKTKAITGGFVFAAGDFLAQRLENKGEYKIERTIMMSTVGMFVIVPQIHFWFKFLDKIVPSKSIKATCGKVIIDQVFGCPWFVFCNMTSVQILSQRNNFDVEQWKTKISENMLPVLRQAWTIWPITNFILFKYVQQDYRLILSNIVSVGWNCLLSTVANKNINDSNNSIENQNIESSLINSNNSNSNNSNINSLDNSSVENKTNILA